MSIEKQTQLQFAEQQLLGFLHAKRGYDIIDLIVSMGLSKNEWEQINGQFNLHMIEQERIEVEEHFNKKKKKKQKS